jgi:hypothetical protein
MSKTILQLVGFLPYNASIQMGIKYNGLLLRKTD